MHVDQVDSSFSSNSNLFCVSVELYVSYHSHSFPVLLDSGLAGNFISQSIVSSLSIPVVKLASPISFNALDGHPSNDCPVTHHTLSLHLDFMPQHSALFQFYVLPTIQSPLV